jgi:long-chain acyl-CoA synthetase
MLIDGIQLDRPAPPLDGLLRIGLGAAPDEVALVSAERALSWRQLEDETARLAGGYRGLGLEPGDRIASLMPNRIDLVVHYLACFRAGLIATPLNYRYTHREIDHTLEVSGARALLAHVERGEDLAASELAGGLELGTVDYDDGRGFEALLAGEPLASGGRAAPADPAVIFFTSRQHRSGQGRHPHPRVAALDDRQRRRRLRTGTRRRLPARLIDVAHRLLPLGAEHARGRRQGWSSPAPPATSCCSCCASTSPRCWR